MKVEGIAILNRFVSIGFTEVVISGQRLERVKESSHPIPRKE